MVWYWIRIEIHSIVYRYRSQIRANHLELHVILVRRPSPSSRAVRVVSARCRAIRFVSLVRELSPELSFQSPEGDDELVGCLLEGVLRGDGAVGLDLDLEVGV